MAYDMAMRGNGGFADWIQKAIAWQAAPRQIVFIGMTSLRIWVWNAIFSNWNVLTFPNPSHSFSHMFKIAAETNP